jgi:hypothetical protein
MSKRPWQKALNPLKPGAQVEQEQVEDNVPESKQDNDLTPPDPVGSVDPIEVLKAEQEQIEKEEKEKILSQPGTVLSILAERAAASGVATPGINKVSDILRQRATGQKNAAKSVSQVLQSRKSDPRFNS